MENVSTWIEQRAEFWPNNIAINTQEKSITYSQLKKDINSFAATCQKLKLIPGDRVAIYSPNSYEAIVGIFGTLKFGAIIVCIHPQTPVTKLITLLKDAKVSLLFADQNIFTNENILPHLKGKIDMNICPSDHDRSWCLYKNYEDAEYTYPLFKDVIEQKIAAIIYTSGSTGQPKGIISTHQNIIFSTKGINKYLHYSSTDKILSYLPFSFDYGLYQLFLAFSNGATLYIRDPKYLSVTIRSLILKESITCLPGLRSVFSAITRFDKTVFKSIRIVTNTGDHLSRALINKMKLRFPNSEIFLMYGLSECKRVSYLPSQYLDSKLNSVGIPLEGTEVMILDSHGKECQLYEKGELYVSGPHVCQGYWEQEQETARTFVQLRKKRYLRTGDIFYRDGDGFLYFVGRKDRLIKSRGFRVDSVELENKISNQFTQIKEVVAVGIPDEIYGHTVGLYIVPQLDTSAIQLKESILEYCKSVFEPWSLPEHILIAQQVMLTTSGKIDREGMTKKILKELKPT